MTPTETRKSAALADINRGWCCLSEDAKNLILDLLQPSPQVPESEVEAAIKQAYNAYDGNPPDGIKTLIRAAQQPNQCGHCDDKGEMLNVCQRCIDHFEETVRNLKAQHPQREEWLERAFRYAWNCGYKSGGKDQHAGNMSGSTCAEDLAEYKKKLPSPPKDAK